MKKLIFINPKPKDFKVGILSPETVRATKQKQSAMPRLAPMVFAKLTPPEYEFIFADEEYEDIDLNMEADLVAISAMTVQINRAYEIADHYRSRGVAVVIGGIHASVLPDEVSQHCDATMVGQGENTWPEMLKDFERGELKKIYDSKDYPPVDNLTSPRVDVVNHDRYFVFPIQATRGCPYDCDFCSVRHSAGTKHRMKPIEQVVAEIKEFEKFDRKGFGYKKSFYFVDENLYVNREYTKKLLTALIDLNITWHAQGTANTAFDEEILDLMSRSGCRTYSIGFESISDETLGEANKPKVNKSHSYDEVTGNLIRHGIIPGGFFIFGFDTDDFDVFKRTVDFVLNSHVMQPFFAVLTPYPGTKIYEKIKGGNRIFDENWDHYNSTTTCVFYPEKLDPKIVENGAMWAAKQVTGFEQIKRSLDYFWQFGPWPRLKTLKFRERLLLILLGLKYKKIDKQYYEFFLWAARHKRACDFTTIFAATHLYEVPRLTDKGDNFEELLKAEKAKDQSN